MNGGYELLLVYEPLAAVRGLTGIGQYSIDRVTGLDALPDSSLMVGGVILTSVVAAPLIGRVAKRTAAGNRGSATLPEPLP